METQENATMTAEREHGVDATQSITPFLWFDARLEEAVNFYTTVFEDAHIVHMGRLPAESPGRPGKASMATFRLNGVEFYALDGGPEPDFHFSPAISFFVKCETQQQVDHYWDKLSEGGATNQCGWLTDKFGVTWQIVPNALMQLMGDPNPVKARNVMNAMMKMTKLDIAGLKAAYDKE
jgi:predicted 3-demethylubiquinone-9 3-methyltransferase (glyoxalase superfamily)